MFESREVSPEQITHRAPEACSTTRALCLSEAILILE